METKTNTKLLEIGTRIREMREIIGYTVDEMAALTDTSAEEYCEYEAGLIDFPFSFIHKCALAFGLEITDILEGHSAKLSAYTVTRKGQGQVTADEEGINIANLAPMFKKKLAEPYWVKYEYSEELQNQPIHVTKHSGQEFDLVLSGKLKIQIGEHTEILEEGDSIYYNSSVNHGMIAVGGEDCVFLAVVLNGDDDAVTQGWILPCLGQTSHPYLMRQYPTAHTPPGRLCFASTAWCTLPVRIDCATF